MAVTLTAIAQQVGVHVSLVSRVLRNDPSAKLSPAKREQILAVAKAAGYRPNRLGRSLRTGRTSVLGMLTPDITNSFHSLLFRGVERAATEAGYDTILCNTDENPERFKEVVSVLSEGHVDGLLVASAKENDQSISWLFDNGLPFIVVNRRSEKARVPWIGPDDFQTGWLGTEHLLSLGHRRIAFVLMDTEIINTKLRVDGVKAALATFGCAPESCWIKTDLQTRAEGKRYMLSLFRLPPEKRPTAIFAPHTVMTEAMMYAAWEAGLRVPEDLSVIGYSGFEDHDITTVHVPILEIGRLAAEHLIDHLGSRTSEPLVYDRTLPVSFVDRGSTASPPGRS